MDIEIRPMAPELWTELEALFADSPVTSRCWCMAPRIGAAYRRTPPEENRAALRKAVERGPTGLLAFAGEVPVGWCALGPRQALPALAKRMQATGDDGRLWCISCLYIRKGCRRRGVATALIAAAIEAARAGGASGLEGYPLDRDLTPSATGTGFVTTYRRLGFAVAEASVPARPIVAFPIKSRRQRMISIKNPR